jgi:hypothetical protein
VFFVYAVWASGSWTGPPDWSQSGEALSNLSITGIAVLLAAAMAMSLFLHPLQFKMTQLLEGYWGTGRVALAFRTRAMRRQALALEVVRPAAHRTQRSFEEICSRGINLDSDDDMLTVATASEYARRRKDYPLRTERIMATSLGNVLRSHEDSVGAQYGLDAVTVAPHLTLVGDPRRVRYLNDAGEQMDLSVHLTYVAFAAFLVSFVFLLTDGWWLIISLIPYALSICAYRGAIAAAHAWGAALAVLVDLDRFTMYEQLHLRLPRNTDEERELNSMLMRQLRFRRVQLYYSNLTFPATPGGRIANRRGERRSRPV